MSHNYNNTFPALVAYCIAKRQGEVTLRSGSAPNGYFSDAERRRVTDTLNDHERENDRRPN